MKHYDVVVLGAGSAGELIANTLAGAGRTVALIEKLRVGGECAYVSCIPSKAMLRSVTARRTAKNLVSLGGASSAIQLDDDAVAYRSAASRRDRIAKFRNDERAASHTRDVGVELIRGDGVFTGVDSIQVESEVFGWTDLVLAMGSSSTIPDIEGVRDIDYWTSDMALSVTELPKSVLIVGGGPVGCELAQIFSGFGAKTTVVQSSKQLAGKEHPEIASRLAQNLRTSGVTVLLDTNVTKLEKESNKNTVAHLSNKTLLSVERVIIAAGRHPNTSDIDILLLGVSPNEKGAVVVDESCRVVGHPHIWAAGDVTGIAPFTHTANYQGRIVAANIMGGSEVANYSAIPRAIYTDPPVASVGQMKSVEKEDELVTSRIELSQESRNDTDGEVGGLLILTADPKRGVLVGAAAIGPHVDEWMAEATLAIRAQIPLAVLCDVVHAFPTYGEAFEQPLRELAGLSEESQANNFN